MMQVHEMVQGTPEWFEVRRGLPTTSKFGAILAKGAGKTRRRYLFDLAGEILTGEPVTSYSNAHMERGNEQEPQARQFYSFLTDEETTQVGFITNHGAGASPDSLVGSDGILEIKSKLPALLLEAHERGRFPLEHIAQCQGQLWITEREWVDLICFCPRMKPLIVRAYRDEEYIANLASEVEQFNADLADIVSKYSLEEMKGNS